MNENIKNFIYGGSAGIISRTLTSPFERLKILRQIYPNEYKKFNLLQSLNYIRYNEGFKGFFKGNYTNCLRIFPQQAVTFSTFSYINNKISNNLEKKLSYFISGGISGIISYLAIYPLETIRSKLSVQTFDIKYNGVVDCFTKSLNKNGLSSLYRGSLLASIGMIPFQGTNFLVYNYLKDNYENSSLNTLLFGSLSGICSVSVSYPFDIIKRKLQLSGENGNPKYKGILDCCKYTFNKQGIKGFYRGLIPCYTKIIPANAIFFLIIEILNNKISILN